MRTFARLQIWLLVELSTAVSTAVEQNGSCAEDKAALLQHRVRAGSPCPTSTTTTTSFVIYIDGKHPTSVPKVSVAKSPYWQYYYVPLGRHGNDAWKLNSTHIVIPVNSNIQATYIRNSTTPESPGWHVDYGVSNMNFNLHETSAFPMANFGAAEKLITFGREGAVPVDFQTGNVLGSALQETTSETGTEPNSLIDSFIQARKQSRQRVVPNAQMTFQRNLLMLLGALAGRPGGQSTLAAIDPLQLQALLVDSLNGDGAIDPSLQNMADYLKRLQSTFKDVSDAYPSSNNCYHFANAPLTSEGIVLPLSKPWLSYKALTTFGPGVKLSVVPGTTVITWNQESNAVEIYFYAVAMSYVQQDSSDYLPSAVYYQGPPHTAPDMRNNTIGPSSDAYMLFQQAMAIPPDFEQFWRNDTCNATKEAQISKMISVTNFTRLVKEDVSQEEALSYMTNATLALDCGHEYMQS